MAAQRGHPVNGVTLYPLIAQRAGLGPLGTNGLMITPQYGPRHRLAAIYTSLSNLPNTATDEHTWVSAFSSWCRLRQPARPRLSSSGLLTFEKPWAEVRETGKSKRLVNQLKTIKRGL